MTVFQTKVYVKEICLDLLTLNTKNRILFQSVRWESDTAGSIRFGLTEESEWAERTGIATTPQSWLMTVYINIAILLRSRHEKLDEPWPGHAYTSHICRFDVFPRFDPERTKFDGK